MRTLQIVSLLVALIVADEAKIEYSTEQKISFTDKDQGNLVFTYKTFLKGDEGFKTGWLHGKIEIKDEKQKNSDAQSATFREYEAYDWPAAGQVRVGMEWEIPGQETQYREQLRFTHMIADGDKLKKDSIVQNVLDFNSTDEQDKGNWIFSFLLLPQNSKKLDNSGLNGVKIIDSKIVKADKTIMIEFERPLDVSYDRSFFLQPEGDYKIHVIWGVFPDADNTQKFNVKGMTAKLAGGNKFEPEHNLGQTWKIEKPPGWDTLISELEKYDPFASAASKLSMTALLSTSMLIMISLMQFH